MFLIYFHLDHQFQPLNPYSLHILIWILLVMFLLTSTNYFSWKSHIKDVLRSKGLYPITLGKKQEPIDDENKFKWDNNNDKACGLNRMSISHDLWFHLQGINAADEAWEKIQAVFGKHDII
jgi:hypothetical protein